MSRALEEKGWLSPGRNGLATHPILYTGIPESPQLWHGHSARTQSQRCEGPQDAHSSTETLRDPGGSSEWLNQ